MKFREYFKKSKYEDILHSLVFEEKSIMDCDLRMGSESWIEFVKVARELNELNKIELSENDKFLLEETDLGRTGIIATNIMMEAMNKGKEVELESPTRTPSGDKKKYMVFIDSGKKDKEGNVIAKLIKWGDPNLSVKNCDKKASKSFLARHQCHLKKDRTTPGWWACNVHRYAKQLKLQCDTPW